MKADEKFVLLAELHDAHCELNHGQKDDPVDHPAVNYITIPLGDRTSKETDKELTIPVCVECLQALEGDEWTLLYCLECTASAWVCQEYAKLRYENAKTGQHYHMIALAGCPKCSKKLNGLYFVDSKE